MVALLGEGIRSNSLEIVANEAQKLTLWSETWPYISQRRPIACSLRARKPTKKLQGAPHLTGSPSKTNNGKLPLLARCRISPLPEADGVVERIASASARKNNAERLILVCLLSRTLKRVYR